MDRPGRWRGFLKRWRVQAILVIVLLNNVKKIVVIILSGSDKVVVYDAGSSRQCVGLTVGVIDLSVDVSVEEGKLSASRLGVFCY